LHRTKGVRKFKTEKNNKCAKVTASWRSPENGDSDTRNCGIQKWQKSVNV